MMCINQWEKSLVLKQLWVVQTHQPMATCKEDHIWVKSLSMYLYLVDAEQGGGSGSPKQLTEAILIVLLEQAALERPQPVCVVHLENTGERLFLETLLKEKLFILTMNVSSQAVSLPCGSTMKQRWQRSDRSGPTPHQRPCSAQQCSSWCSLTCQQRQELRSCCKEKWQLTWM